MILRARWVIPVSSPPIKNGIVVIQENKISDVGVQLIAPQENEQILDLRDCIVFPGLVNAHAHLEFSQTMKSTPSFTEWVQQMTSPEADCNPPRHTNRIDQLIQGGTTTAADHCSPESPPLQTPFRRIIFWEVLGADRERAKRSLESAKRRAWEEGGFVTPHSLYGVHPEILREIISPLQSIHLLESSDEDQWIHQGTGPLADFVRERGGDLPPSPSLVRRGLGGGLIIHGNYLQPQEIEALRGTGASVIHCPGSHQFFGHKRFPYEEFMKSGISIGLGTDSLASNEELSMLREMRLFHETYPTVPLEEILRMSTIEGAKALKMENEIGSIEVGKKADLVAIRVGTYSHTPLQAIVRTNEVSFSMIDGKVIKHDV